MTVHEAITLLLEVQRQHGNVEVYFDCPHCVQSFTPGKIVTKAVVINAAVTPARLQQP